MKGNLLNVPGHMALVKATLSAIPVHTAIALCLCAWAIDCIDKLHRAFIWIGSDAVSAGRCKVAWEMVCRPRDLGGLGVADLCQAGIALRVRWEWLRRIDPGADLGVTAKQRGARRNGRLHRGDSRQLG